MSEEWICKEPAKVSSPLDDEVSDNDRDTLPAICVSDGTAVIIEQTFGPGTQETEPFSVVRIGSILDGLRFGTRTGRW